MGNRQSTVIVGPPNKRVVPLNEPGKKQNFLCLCNLFAKSRFDPQALAATCPPPVNFPIFDS